MSATEDIFKLIKKKRSFLGNIENYKFKISNSNNFERDNLIGIYKIRRVNAVRNNNQKFLQEIDELILNLENYDGYKLKFVSVLGDKYYGIFYLSEDWEKVVGFLESELDENGNIIN